MQTWQKAATALPYPYMKIIYQSDDGIKTGSKEAVEEYEEGVNEKKNRRKRIESSLKDLQSVADNHSMRLRLVEIGDSFVFYPSLY